MDTNANTEGTAKMGKITVHRIATVKAIGRRFLVSRIDFPKQGEPKVFCLGDITSARATANGGANARYADHRVFLGSEVEIEERPFTWELCQELWFEAMEIKAARLGRALIIRGKRHREATSVPASVLELVVRAAEAEDQGRMELAEAYMTGAALA